MKHAVVLLAALGILSACKRPAPEPTTPVDAPTSAPVSDYPLVEPREPGPPGGLPDDRTPLSEAPFTPTSAQGAADVMQVYYAQIGQHEYAKAWALWSQGSPARAASGEAFTASFGAYLQYNAHVGSPGAIEGAAGSLFIEVPIQVYGRLKTGQELHQLGKATLRRSNDVPGATPEQRLWRIDRIELTTVP